MTHESDIAADLLGMTPAAHRNGAPGEVVRYAFTDTSLGRLVVARTRRGVCFAAFGESDTALLDELRTRFSQATVEPDTADGASWLCAIAELVDTPGAPARVPLDVRGTAFQQQVWNALREIEPGTTVTYAQLAAAIGRPSAVRAVAQACGANPLAVVIPCHRVIGAAGSLTGYRWGVARKRELLDREHQPSKAGSTPLDSSPVSSSTACSAASVNGSSTRSTPRSASLRASVSLCAVAAKRPTNP